MEKIKIGCVEKEKLERISERPVINAILNLFLKIESDPEIEVKCSLDPEIDDKDNQDHQEDA